MLPDLSPAHILIVVIVALVVVGPKDLPVLLRKIGQFMGRMRGMANEFRASFDEMARQSELEELRKEVEAMRKASQAALPQDLGIESSEAEANYLAQWQASHATPTDELPAAEPGNSILPPTSVDKAAAASEAYAQPAPMPAPMPAPDVPAKAAAKPRARSAAAKASAPKTAPKAAGAADAKPARARKPKPAGDDA